MLRSIRCHATACRASRKRAPGWSVRSTDGTAVSTSPRSASWTAVQSDPPSSVRSANGFGIRSTEIGNGPAKNWPVQRSRSLQRAMSLGGTAAFMVPFALDPSIINVGDSSFNQVRQAARKVTIASDVWHGVSNAGIMVSWDVEAQEVSDDAPVLVQPTIPVHKTAALVPISIEALQDAGERRRGSHDPAADRKGRPRVDRVRHRHRLESANWHSYGAVRRDREHRGHNNRRCFRTRRHLQAR